MKATHIPLQSALGLLSLLSICPACAQSWLKPTGINDWNDPANWGGAAVPTGALGETRLVNGHAELTGTGTTYSFWIGGTGPGGIGVGTLTIKDGGIFNSNACYLGPNPGGDGTINVTGTGVWNSTGSNAQLYVGISNGVGGGPGKINLTAGGQVFSNGGTYVGYGTNSVGTVTINGASSQWTVNGNFYLGAQGGTGTLTLEDGGRLRSGAAGTGYLIMPYVSGTGTLNIGSGGAPGILEANIVYVTSSSKVVFNHNDPAYTFAPALTGSLLVEQKGSGTTILGGVLSHTGATRVLGGGLVVKAATLADAAPVEIATGATLALDFAGTDTVQSLTLGGQLAVPGTWGASGSGADHESALITGTGKLLATTGAVVVDPYLVWIATQDLPLPADQDIDADPDKDGLINLIEYALNLRAAVPDLPPAATLDGGVLKLSYTLNLAATDASVTPEWSDDLETWHSGDITINPLGDSGSTRQMEATIPAPTGSKLFLRLRVLR